MITLAIEAATYVGSVALFDDGRGLGEQTVAMRGREHEALMPATAAALAGAGMTLGRVDRIVCGAGPGAFTSLRIAGGIGKGLALAAGLPLIPVSSLALVVASHPPAAGRYLAALDAMRGEHYVQPFEVTPDGTIVEEGPAVLMATSALASAAQAAGANVVGPGQPGDRHRDPHARGIGRLTNLLASATPADLASWEPAYGRLAEAQVKWEAAHGRPLVVP